MHFTDMEQLLVWSAEVLRMRRWRGASSNVYHSVDKVDGGGAVPLRQLQDTGDDHHDRAALAGKVWHAMTSLPDGMGEALALYMLGDYAQPERLARAEAFQAAMRKKGMRVRLSVRYSYRQLGLLWGCDPKTAARRVRAAMLALEERLRHEGVLQPAGVDYGSGFTLTDNFNNMI